MLYYYLTSRILWLMFVTYSIVKEKAAGRRYDTLEAQRTLGLLLLGLVIGVGEFLFALFTFMYMSGELQRWNNDQETP